MITFKTLSLKNFLSYGAASTVVELDVPGATLIIGKDLDNTEGGSSSNGVGKTTIINALTYALYDKPISTISKDNLINNINKKNMEVSIEFHIKGCDYVVTRARKSATGNWVQLFRDGVDITLGTAAHTNAAIEKILGIRYELFIRIVAVSATSVPFFNLPVRAASGANQTDIIEELFDLKRLSEMVNVLKLQIKDTTNSIKIQTVTLDSAKREHDRHATQIEQSRLRVANWVVTRDADIVNLQQALDSVASVDLDAQKKLIDESAAISDSLSEGVVELRVIKKVITDQTTIIDKISVELKHLDDATCPYCLQQYEDSEAKKVELAASKVVAEAALTEAQGMMADNTANSTKLTKQKEAIDELIVVTNLDDLMEIKSQQSVLESQIVTLTESVNPFITVLEDLEAITLESVDATEVNNLNTLHDHQKFLLKALSKKDSFVRKALLSKNIPFLNQQMHTYLKALGLPHMVEFTQQMTSSISQFGRKMDFGNLSSGQQARVNIALSFAFRDVLQNMHGYVNVYLLDEILDVGLDAVGIQAAANLLKTKAEEEAVSLYVISHRDEIDSVFNRTLLIEKCDGFSSIAQPGDTNA